MKKLLLLLFVLFMGGASRGSDVDQIVTRVVAAVPAEWTVNRDAGSVTLIRPSVRMLNPLSLPMLDAETIWKKYSFSADYRITISWSGLVTLDEYSVLLKTRDSIIQGRCKNIAPGTKEYWNAGMKARNIVCLPQYYDQRFSYYVYSSDEAFFDIRPIEVKKVKEAVQAILGNELVPYQKEGASW